MLIRQPKLHLLATCLVLSVVVHAAAFCAMRIFGSFHFGPAAGEAAIMVSLADLPAASAPAEPPTAHEKNVEAPVDDPAPAVDQPAATEAANARSAEEAPPMEQLAAAAETPPEQTVAEATSPAPPAEEMHAAAEAPTAHEPEPAAAKATSVAAPVSTPSTETRGRFPAVREEKLTYLISMLGLPIGKAELEAKRGERGTTLTLRVRSNPAMSGIYPVDDLVETQQVDGRYLMTRVQQREGKFRGDEGFSINLPQRTVSWSDNINSRSKRMTVPTGEVLDTLSGIYSLRNRPLQVGKTETLHIFDSETYSEVPVDVLRREEMRLPDLSRVNALVVRPLQKTAGIFRRTGDILIWMTDDANKVPVKIVTTIPLGRVTAELVSAQSEAGDAGSKGRGE